MASAALKQEEPGDGVVIPGEGEGGGDNAEVQTGERDFEAEARELGWLPETEFMERNPKADPKRCVDAKTFVERSDTMMPLLKAKLARVERQYQDMKKDVRRATAHFEGAEKRAFDRAKSELEARVEAAIEAGDLEEGRKALKEIGELAPVEAPKQHSKEEATEALDAFREENAWYDKANLASASELEINGRLYFDRMIDKHIERTKDMAPAEFFGFISDMTLEKYPALKGKPARQKPASAVEGVGAGRPAGRGRTWADLPDGAKRQYERFINRGIGVKSTGDADKDAAAAKAYYAKTHDWEGYKE